MPKGGTTEAEKGIGCCVTETLCMGLCRHVHTSARNATEHETGGKADKVLAGGWRPAVAERVRWLGRFGSRPGSCMCRGAWAPHSVMVQVRCCLVTAHGAFISRKLLVAEGPVRCAVDQPGGSHMSQPPPVKGECCSWRRAATCCSMACGRGLRNTHALKHVIFHSKGCNRCPACATRSNGTGRPQMQAPP